MVKKYSTLYGLLIVLCLIANSVYGQNTTYDDIITYANKAPFDVQNSTQKLSSYLVKPYTTEIDKFASIYYWVAKNISYDDKQAENPRLYTDSKEIINDVMKSKSGVCQHFAELFAELAHYAGLTAYVIDGYTIDKGKVANLSHAWNLVKISGNWYFIDATWANAVILSKGKKTFPKEYFMVEPSENIKTHMPFDPIWQILLSPLKYDQFDALKFDISDGKFNYNDSINDYLKLNSIDQQKATIRRMVANGTFNPVLKKEFALKEKNLKTTIENEEIYKYNKGIVVYNQGLAYLNQYIKLRNNKFKDKKYGKNALLDMLDSAKTDLKNAEDVFLSVKIQDSKLKSQVKTNLTTIKKSYEMIDSERVFVEQFFK